MEQTPNPGLPRYVAEWRHMRLETMDCLRNMKEGTAFVLIAFPEGQPVDVFMSGGVHAAQAGLIALEATRDRLGGAPPGGGLILPGPGSDGRLT